MSPTALGVGRAEAAAEAEAEEEEAQEAAARLARTPAMPPHPQMGCADSFDGFELVLDSPSDGLPGPDLGGHPARGDGPGGDNLCEVELQRQRELPAAEEAHGDDARLDPRLDSPLRAATISRPAPPPTPINRAASVSDRGSPLPPAGRVRTPVHEAGLGQAPGPHHGDHGGEAEADTEAEAEAEAEAETQAHTDSDSEAEAEAEAEAGAGAEAKVGVIDYNQTELAPVGDADCAPAETELAAVGDTEGEGRAVADAEAVGVRSDTEPVGEQTVGARGETELGMPSRARTPD